MMILNQSNVDGEDITSEHQTSLPSQSHHDREELRQQLLGKVCFTSSVLKKPKPKPSKKKSSEESVVVEEDEGTDDVQHHDTEVAKPQRRCRSKHSQRRAAKWRSQQRGRIRQPDDDCNG
mmetsp:Transcript_1364/g.2002  ORF Transcript_1364/g.2002 Transcript_1364/m.2002 type:complete len:120 (-) Transcript_1364:98-457(-)